MKTCQQYLLLSQFLKETGRLVTNSFRRIQAHLYEVLFDHLSIEKFFGCDKIALQVTEALVTREKSGLCAEGMGQDSRLREAADFARARQYCSR